jgi:energy-coupling factor transporter transmembrane protein EcfT
MAELTAVGYRPGRSFPHRLDPRVKLAAAALFAFGAMGAGPSGLGLLAGVLLAGFLAARISPLDLLADLRYFPMLLASVVLVRGWAVPGPPAFSAAGISFSEVGLREGALIAGRLGTVAAAGLLLVATTRIAAIRDAIVWLLRPVPGLPEGRVAVMLSLLIRFLPVILFRARETGEAQRARCVERRRNPVYRLRRFSVSLLRRVFLDADALAVAMDARCYSDFRTPPIFRFTRSDGLALALASILAGFARML